MPQTPNIAVLNDALALYRKEMRVFIPKALKRVRVRGNLQALVSDALQHRDRVSQFNRELLQNGGDVGAALDINDFPDIIRTYWREAFESDFGSDRMFQSLTYLIRSARNAAAHPGDGDMDKERARSHLTLIAQALDMIGAADAQRETEAIRDRAFPLRDSPYTLGGEIPFAGMELSALAEEARECRRCRLHLDRKHVVFGEGSPDADLMLIGLAPGKTEDQKGAPYRTPEPKARLESLIAEAGMRREDAYVSYLLKCRLSMDGRAFWRETERCRPYLLRQIERIQPRVIVALGAEAASALIEAEFELGVFSDMNGIRVMPTHSLEGPPPSAYQRRVTAVDGIQLMMDLDAPTDARTRMDREGTAHMALVKAELERA